MAIWTDTRCLISPGHLLTFALFVGFPIAIGGCAAPARISPAERATITNVVVQEAHPGVVSELSWALPESRASGLVGGALGGFFGGILTLPVTWIVGGPITTTPLVAARMGGCGAAVSEVEEPAMRLKKIMDDVEPRAFRSALDFKLAEILKVREMSSAEADKADNPSKALVTGKILEIKEITIVLDGTSPKDNHWTCRPDLRAKAVWRVINSADGQQLEERFSSCAIPTSTETFKEWFANAARRRTDVTALLESLGSQVVRDLLFNTSTTCDYRKVPAEPERPIEPN
jgi:hypothetical protein